MAGPEKPLCILVVDDERIIADTLALIFRQRGFETHAAYSGEEAVGAAAACTPDVFLSDIHMTGMNGIEAAIVIADRFPLCRILLFSGHPGANELLAKARQDGHKFEALPKPVHPQTIIDWIAGSARERTTGV
ncbi:MAG TPA: response regulator [Terracidiphilus sp.]|nr:response regulator [Terracidiphilus sp.]